MSRLIHQPKRLFVEGFDEQRVIPQLIESHGVAWGEKRAEWIVEIVEAGGISKLLDPELLSTHFDDPTLTHLGLLLDADDDAEAAFRAARGRCLRAFPTLPVSPAVGGVVVESEGRTLGIWVMPDNLSRGMLETFLAVLVDASDPVWRHAIAAREQAVALGAPIKASHHDKADVHTWLAWRDPPGRQLHDAIKQRILRVDSPMAGPFVAWFRRTFAV